VRRGRCQLHDTVPPTPVRLTRRALKGGPTAPSNIFYVLVQGHAVTSCRRDPSSLSLSALCGYPRHCCTTPDTVATSQHCWDVWGQDIATTATVPRTDPRQWHPRAGPPRRQSTNRYTANLEAIPIRAQDAPRRLNRSGIRQDGCQLRSTVRHTSTRREIVRHACKLLFPWPIKGGAAPQPRGHETTDSDRSHALRLLHDIGTRLNQHLWDLEVTPSLPLRL
jgi:hypothetical protein